MFFEKGYINCSKEVSLYMYIVQLSTPQILGTMQGPDTHSDALYASHSKSKRITEIIQPCHGELPLRTISSFVVSSLFDRGLEVKSLEKGRKAGRSRVLSTS